jgi:hypothetical protein
VISSSVRLEEPPNEGVNLSRRRAASQRLGQLAVLGLE